MKSYLSSSFRKHNEPGFLAKMETIDASLGTPAALALYTEPIGPADECPTRVEFHNAVVAHAGLVAAAEDGSKARINDRNVSRAKLTEWAQSWIPHLQIAANYDRTKLSLTGYDILKDGASTPPESETNQAPQNVRVVNGKFSGMVVVSGKTVAGARGYEVQFCIGDPGVAANWKLGASSAGSTHIELTGLTPGQVCYVRMRATFGKKGPGAWSDLAQIIVT